MEYKKKYGATPTYSGTRTQSEVIKFISYLKQNLPK